MSVETITAAVLEQQKKWEDVLFLTEGLYSGVENLSDLKKTYGRKNAENWVNSFSYNQGDLTTYNDKVYISNSSGNVGNIPSDLAAWGLIDGSSLMYGSIYPTAFANIGIEISIDGASGTAVMIPVIKNGLNIAAATNLTPFGESSGLDHTNSVIIDVDFEEGANIIDEYIVMLSISRTGNWNHFFYSSGNPGWNEGYYDQNVRPRVPVLVGKTKYGFTFSTESFEQDISIVVIPKQ